MSGFVEYLQEVFELFGPIRARKMFGGYGIYHSGLMFALVDDDTLYLKADAENARTFEERGLRQFEYVRNGKVMKMSYYLAPDELLDDREQAAAWARRSYEAALRSPSAKRKPKRKK
ncbi:MAG: TfoX/Sxy family protein [Pseudomonadota bacterium]